MAPSVHAIHSQIEKNLTVSTTLLCVLSANICEKSGLVFFTPRRPMKIVKTGHVTFLANMLYIALIIFTFSSGEMAELV
jgi:hypothetical protein